MPNPRSLLSRFCVVALVAFVYQQARASDANAVQQKIAHIEKSISPVFRIKGEEATVTNLNDRLKELGIPGLSVAVVAEGTLQWAKGYGMADVASGRELDANTLFLAGSISKPISAVRLHQLAESQVVDLDANVNNYLTSWKVPDNKFTETEKVTLRRILNHTAGLTVWGFPGYDKGDKVPDAVAVLDGKGNTPAVRVYKTPGESWQYSGGGYTIMQLLVEDVLQVSFAETLQKHVLNPLGMTDSTFENPLPERYHAIAATGYRANGAEVEGKWPIYPEMAAAGLWTTPSQLIRYAIEMMSISRTETDGVLKKETVANMLTPGMNGHGLGPTITEHTFGQGGSDQGFRATLVAWKGSPNAVVIMVNSDNGRIMRELMLAIAAEYELPGFEPSVKSIAAISATDRQKYTGTYEIQDLGKVTVTVKEAGLELSADFQSEAAYYLPETQSKFFHKTEGNTLTFTFDGDLVTGFQTRGVRGAKIN